MLWEKIDDLRVDAVTKNLGIEDTNPHRLTSKRHPYHLIARATLSQNLTGPAYI